MIKMSAACMSADDEYTIVDQYDSTNCEDSDQGHVEHSVDQSAASSSEIKAESNPTDHVTNNNDCVHVPQEINDSPKASPPNEDIPLLEETEEGTKPVEGSSEELESPVDKGEPSKEPAPEGVESVSVLSEGVESDSKSPEGPESSTDDVLDEESPQESRVSPKEEVNEIEGPSPEDHQGVWSTSQPSEEGKVEEQLGSDKGEESPDVSSQPLEGERRPNDLPEDTESMEVDDPVIVDSTSHEEEPRPAENQESCDVSNTQESASGDLNNNVTVVDEQPAEVGVAFLSNLNLLPRKRLLDTPTSDSPSKKMASASGKNGQ